jgi:mono/diheme cytochrome c family protein
MRSAALFLILLASCNNMVRQPRYDSFGDGSLFADGKAMQTPPAGTVARDPGSTTSPARPPMNLALLRRGQERYDIFCSMCHGFDGSGAGTVSAPGFPQPADFRAASQRALAAEQIYRAISQGQGVMYGFADRVPPRDRWAMTAYVEALQRNGTR